MFGLLLDKELQPYVCPNTCSGKVIGKFSSQFVVSLLARQLNVIRMDPLS